MIYVVYSAYNEEEEIRPTLLALADALSRTPFRAVLVDDGSTDGTVAEAQRAASERGDSLPLIVLRHERNRGLGVGLRTGIGWCLEHARDEDVIVTLDADQTHPPTLIPALVAKLDQGHELAIASRYRSGSGVLGVPAHRRVLSDLGRLVFQALYPIPGVRDYTCCFRAYRAALLRRARLLYGDLLFTASGFEAVVDLLLRLAPLGVRVAEVGFVLDYGGRVGRSKMKVLRTVVSTLRLLVRRRIERVFRYRPTQVRAWLAAQPADAPSRPSR